MDWGRSILIILNFKSNVFLAVVKAIVERVGELEIMMMLSSS